MKEDHHDESSVETKKERKKENKNKDGFPDIADLKKANPNVILAFVAIVGLAGYGLWHEHKPKTQTTTTNDAFHVQQQPAPLVISDNGNAVSANQPRAVINNNQANGDAARAENAQKALMARIQAPIMVVGQNASDSDATVTKNETNKTATSHDPNTRFLNQVSDQTTVTNDAIKLQHRDTLLTQGTLIHAVLETAINSDLPGYLRAIVSYPVYADDGSQMLIPAGSKLIGQYKSRMANGQSRIFVVWTRVITPNGISVSLGSPGVDSLGVAGLNADKIDYHFWQMFGTATLLSVLGAGASNIGVNSSDPYNASQAYRQAVSESLAQTAQNSLEKNTMIPPTLHINQGMPIIIFVAKDLQFDQAMPTNAQEIRVF